MELVYQITPDGFALIITEEQLLLLEETERQQALRFLHEPWSALLDLGLEDPVSDGSASLKYLQKVASSFVIDLLRAPGLEEQREKIALVPDEYTLENLLENKPFIREASLIDQAWIENAYAQLLEVFKEQIASYPGSVKKFFNERNPKFNPAEAIFFHLVENKDDIYPFAFLATYTHQTESGATRHLPLSEILKEYQDDQKKILELLSCLNQAAEICPMLGRLMATGELFHPIGLKDQEAYAFLKSVGELEKAGIVCRIPNWWRTRSSALSLNVKIADKKPSLLGLDSLISITPQISAEGMKLTKAEIKQLLNRADGLALIKGKWVEVNHEKLEELLAQMEKFPESMDLRQAMMMQAGISEPEWMQEHEDSVSISRGKWMASVFDKLSAPEIIRKTALPKKLNATLRPYQQDGYNWLNALSSLRFGALLADDMGLGKTVQTLAWLEKEHQKDPEKKALLVVPASLLANWQKEAAQFTPDLSVGIIHGKKAVADFEKSAKEDLPFLNLTTYGMVSRLEALKDIHWDFLVLDEAQAIKNPKTKQTSSIKGLQADMRLAMTGTPIENDLINLWSIFDFLNRGVLGTQKEFAHFIKQGQESNSDYLGKLQKTISPFLLRRLKSDKSIISDLPDKIEQNDYIELSDSQIVLYKKVVSELEAKLVEKQMQKTTGEEGSNTGIDHKGLVLAALSKLKQVCNHPDQYLGDYAYVPAESGKFKMLAELCEPIAQNHESVLVFTQYREMTEHLASFLETIFGAKGFVIHGQTPVKQRQEIVDAFNQQETYIPFVVLSLRAAGTGLNLTQASHVIHFDRWWNPAVENQATDRAYRIGQKKNVIVHKFVCSNTIEEKINEMIESKQKLADDVVGTSAESWLTTLSDEDLIDAMRMSL